MEHYNQLTFDKALPESEVPKVTARCQHSNRLGTSQRFGDHLARHRSLERQLNCLGLEPTFEKDSGLESSDGSTEKHKVTKIYEIF